SGGSQDIDYLDGVQRGLLSKELLNVVCYSEPVAPLLVARKKRAPIPQKVVIGRIQRAKKCCEILFVEGAGGLLAPLGESFSNAELIQELGCPVILVARNRVGVINHVRLTVRELERTGKPRITVVLMGCARSDLSVKTNAKLI